MNLLAQLTENAVWQEFLTAKTSKRQLTKQEQKDFATYIDSKAYLPYVEKILQGQYPFTLPEKKLVNKLGKSKKRVVYSFPFEQNAILKVIAYQLYRYDHLYSPNLFSFRRSFGVKRGICSITSQENINNCFCYKLDISNYFNSMDCEILLNQLSFLRVDDPTLYNFFRTMLLEDKCISNGEVLTEKRGAMAGTPVSPFFANLYLAELDEYFYCKKIPYARYSDDIITFADSLPALQENVDYIKNFLSKMHLTVNADKEKITAPNQTWEFLGISYLNGETDISSATKQKMKGKIKRKARALLRWKNKKDVPLEKAVRLMVKIYNFKFFGRVIDNVTEFSTDDLTWSRFFFPVITTVNGLKEIDAYMQQQLRYLVCGRHTKKNYEVLPYQTLKEYGYVSLVNRYYKWKSEKLPHTSISADE